MQRVTKKRKSRKYNHATKSEGIFSKEGIERVGYQGKSELEHPAVRYRHEDRKVAAMELAPLDVQELSSDGRPVELPADSYK